MTVDEARARVGTAYGRAAFAQGDAFDGAWDEVKASLDALIQAVRDEEHERLGATIHAPIDVDFFVTHIRLGGRTIEVMPPEPLGGGTVTEITWVESARPLEPASPTEPAE